MQCHKNIKVTVPDQPLCNEPAADVLDQLTFEGPAVCVPDQPSCMEPAVVVLDQLLFEGPAVDVQSL